MASGLLKPLAVFCSQSQSQHYIESVRNIGNTRRSLTEQPLLDCNKNSTLIETSFDLVLKMSNGLEEQRQLNPTIVEITTSEPATISANQSTPTQNPRHNRIFADYGTDFIWRDPGDVTPEEGDTVVDPEELLTSSPPSVLEYYDAWVNTYTENFLKRRDEAGHYHITTFATGSEEVTWNVAGFLLAWRIVMVPEVGRLEFTAGSSKYLLEKGKETSTTLQFDFDAFLNPGPESDGVGFSVDVREEPMPRAVTPVQRAKAPWAFYLSFNLMRYQS
ncbi:uncharacterized protein N7503_010614 [Penicillium pulvis]|uniref:uncharacterized protein n=1 Tax=Penicillium pulvis TaxID=1562058 RepID=UPI002549A4D6|nr:uncharacterized protein N7503_010614 [Penicillium pulvis]KAJ5785402.1 hypothetical protein N7503_010614 [Penicillium pulvis]